MNETMNKKSNKKPRRKTISTGLLATLIVFAAIGIISVGYFGVKCTMSLIDKINGNAEVAVIEINESNDSSIAEPTTANTESGTAESGESLQDTQNTSVADNDTNMNDLGISVGDFNVSNVRDNSTHEDGKKNVVFLGDSMIDNFRDVDGIAYIVGTALDANIYNLGVGGMAASCSRTTTTFGDEDFRDFCGITIAKIIAGKIDVNVLPDCTAKKLLVQHIDEIRAADVIFVEYGINDFLSGREQNNPDDRNDYRTYQGALISIFNSLKEACPNAKIVMCAPSYVEFYRDNGEYIGNSITLNNGLGTEEDFGRKAEYVAGLYENTLFYPLAEQGISMENSYETMLDDVHLNAKGRAIYSENLIKFLERNGITKDSIN